MLAFLSSKIGAYLIGAVVIAALVGGGYWYVKHLQGEVADLKTEVSNLKLEQKVLADKQTEFDKFVAKSTKVQRRVINEQKTIDQTINTVDDPGLQQLYDRYRVRGKGEVRNPAAKGKGRSQNATGGSP